jgi:folate-binding protein YgfZ
MPQSHSTHIDPMALGKCRSWGGSRKVTPNAMEAVNDVAGMTAEYEAARSAAALVALDERAVLLVSGPQRQKFLNSLLSNEVLKLQPGQGCLAALLDVKGHVAALMRVLVAVDSVRLELPAERLPAVEETLQHYRVAAPVRFASSSLRVLGLVGAGAREVLANVGASLPELALEAHAETTIAGVSLLAARASDLPCGGFVLHVEGGSAPLVREALLAAGARTLGRPALDALRVEQGLAWYGPDVGPDSLLHETGLVRQYHSSTKGCYLGQEVVARLEARGGNVSKALRGLRLAAPTVAGARVLVGSENVGWVTTAALSPRLGPIALAYVHRNHFAPGTRLTVDGHEAEVAGLPFAVEP